MGGCKCTFQDCNVSTVTAKKLNRETHFFHFPIRDLDRCVQWAIYSNNMDFLELHSDKLKNKVICDLHFVESHFMNYKREKLNKTNAVPTIYISPENIEVDLMHEPFEYVAINKAKNIPTTFRDSAKIDLQEETPSTAASDDLMILESPVAKKTKTEVAKSPTIRILNRNANTTPASYESLPAKGTLKKLPTVKEAPQLVKVGGQNYTIRQNQPKASSTPKIIKQEILKAAEPVDMIEQFDLIEEVKVDEDVEHVVLPEKNSSEDLKPMLEESMKQIAELKEMIKNQASTSIEKPEELNLTQSQLNKVQLFNGIKRYLSPSMSALLRLELFAAPNREYKKDEKIICQELLSLGAKSYDFLSEEWRLRLPAKENVQKWILEEKIELDDDAS